MPTRKGNKKLHSQKGIVAEGKASPLALAFFRAFPPFPPSTSKKLKFEVVWPGDLRYRLYSDFFVDG